MTKVEEARQAIIDINSCEILPCDEQTVQKLLSAGCDLLSEIDRLTHELNMHQAMNTVHMALR